MRDTFKALVLDQKDGDFSAAFRDIAVSDLPEGDVTVAVEYSTITTRTVWSSTAMWAVSFGTFRMFPGSISRARSKRRIRMRSNPVTRWSSPVGAWARCIGVVWDRRRASKPHGWCRLPAGLTTKQAMAVGTAGFTSMLCVDALESHGLSQDNGEILVTGGVGGVGSVAIAILANLGYTVSTSTGRRTEDDYLRDLGASEILDRAELSEVDIRPA